MSDALYAKVVRVELGELFTDDEPRITLKFEKADLGCGEIRIRIGDLYDLGTQLRLGDKVTIQIDRCP